MNRKQAWLVWSLCLLLFHLPYSVSAAAMDSDVQFGFEGEVPAGLLPKTEAEKVVEEAGNAVEVMATGKLPQTGELKSLGLVLLGSCLVGFILFFFYKKKKKKPPIDSEVKG